MNKNKFYKKLTSGIFYFSIILFIIAFNFSDNPKGGWYQQFLPNLNGASISDITFTDSLNGYAVTSSPAYILKTTNGGDNWNIRYSNSDNFIRIEFVNQSTGFTNAFQTIFKTTNAGENWIPINLPGDLFGDDMWVLNEDTIWLAQSTQLVGGLFRTTNGGQSWIRQFGGISNNPDKVYFFNANLGFISVNSVKLFRTTDGGANWSLINGIDGFRQLYFADSLTGWLCSNSGGFMRKTTNGGLNWVTQTLQSGGYIQNSFIFHFSNVNKDTIWGTGGYVLYPNNQARAILHRTTNGGENWSYQIPDTSIPISSLAFIDFVNKKHGWSYRISPTGIHTKSGGDTLFLSIRQISSEIPLDFMLYQNYPNPFNPVTKIKFDIQKSGNVKLIVYDLLGKELNTLVNEKLSAGSYEYSFDAGAYPSGVYFYSLIEEKFTITKKMLLTK